MGTLHKNKLLEYVPNSREGIRELFDLDKPGRMDEAVDLVLDWAKSQTHFQRSEFPRSLVEMMIIHNKGSLERTKERLDKLCTYRNTMPGFYGPFNLKTEFNEMFQIANLAIMPKMTDDYDRIMLFRGTGVTFLPKMYTQYYRYARLISEYEMGFDHFAGFIIVLDMRQMNLFNFLSHMNLLEFRQIVLLYFEGLGMRTKGIHLISESKMIEGFVKILKQLLSAKLGGRIHVHSTVESLYTHMPRPLLPQEYGGTERPLLELRDEWIEILNCEEFKSYMKERDEFGVIETARVKDIADTEFMGLPGTFRSLAVD